MPGLIGYFDPEGELPGKTLQKMAMAMEVSSDYKEAFCEFPWGGIGTVDHMVSSGAGKIHTGDGDRRFVLSGEFHGLNGEHWDGDSLGAAKRLLSKIPNYNDFKKARGHFAAAVLDEENRALYFVTDKFGLYPIYWAKKGNIFLFSSEQKSILAAGVITPQIDRSALNLMLSIGEVCGDQTLIAEIKTIPAGSVYSVNSKKAEVKSYWRYCYNVEKEASWKEKVEEAGVALKGVVSRICYSRDDVAVPLSGGLDSRLLAALAHEKTEVKATTWGTNGCRDLVFAKEVAAKIGCNHRTFTYQGDFLSRLAGLGVWRTEGLTSATNLSVLPYVNEVSQESKTVLDGFGGDGVLGGNFIKNSWLNETNSRSAGDALWRWRLSSLWGAVPEELCLDLPGYNCAKARERFICHYRSYSGESSMDRTMAFLVDNRIRRNTIIGPLQFRPQASVFLPFLDGEFIEVIRSLPHHWRRWHRFYLAVLSRFAPIAAQARWHRTALPASLPFFCSWLSLAFHRTLSTVSKVCGYDPFPGRTLTPYNIWFREEIREFIQKLLINERTLDRGWIPADFLKNTVNLHLQGEKDLTYFLGVAINLELFARHFLDDLDGSIKQFREY